MRRCNVPLRNVPNLVATCIVLRNLCITMKDNFDEDQILEAEEQSQKIIENGDFKERQELCDERVPIFKVKGRIWNRKN